MPESNKIVGYKRIFGFILPDTVDEKEIKKYLFGVLAIIAMLSILFFYIWPKKDELAKAKKALTQSEARLSTLTESKKSLDDLDVEMNDETQRAVFMAMPVTYSPQEAVAAMRSVATRTGVTITSYKLPSGVLYDSSLTENQNTKIDGGTKGGGIKFQSFRLRVNLSGRIASLVEFVALIKASLPVASVSDLGIQELTSLNKKSSDSNVQLEVEVIYYQPVIKSYDLTLLKRFSSEEQTLMGELKSYLPQLGETNEVAPVAGGSNLNIFGL